MKIYTLKNIDNYYHQLFQFGLAKRFKLLFVVRNRIEQISDAFKKEILSHHIKKVNTNAWPGTISKEKDISLYYFNLVPDLIETLLKYIPTLSDWSAPNYPEDLSLIRDNGKPFFVSISHEKYNFFKLEDSELASLKELLGNSDFHLVGEDNCPNEKF